MQNPAFLLTKWYEAEGRDLPWRRTRDPYKIWLSEIILQQTRIDQGTSYYHKFVELFPTVHDLAAAENDTVMKAWEGLGYYSRARNLHHTAKVVAETMDGTFPGTYQELMDLKGIGPYTSRAIGSIAFGNRAAVLDGNVFRVLSRYLADFRPIDAPATRKAFQQILDDWIQNVDPAAFNQGMMDLGATICTPKKPSCPLCPVSMHCTAYKQGSVLQLPVKAKKVKRSTVHLHFYLVERAGNYLIRKRPAKGIWPNLWEIPNHEVEEKTWKKAGDTEGELLGAFKHVLTHRDLMIKAYRTENYPGEAGNEAIWVGRNGLKNYGFSRAVLKIFERYLPDIS
ncbi:MAG: A/G-specific adenine glycosylase [Bacteroidota bacterium]